LDSWLIIKLYWLEYNNNYGNYSSKKQNKQQSQNNLWNYGKNLLRNHSEISELQALYSWRIPLRSTDQLLLLGLGSACFGFHMWIIHWRIHHEFRKSKHINLKVNFYAEWISKIGWEILPY